MHPSLHLPAVSGCRARHGFALVIVLVILSLLAVITVGYLSSMASERATASAFSNKTRAEQAAQAGVDEAIGILRDYFRAFPDSATTWDTSQSTNQDNSLNEGTTLYLRAVPLGNGIDTPDPAPNLINSNSANADFIGGNGPNDVNASTGVDNRKIFVLPLVSGATVKQLANKSSTLPKLTADSTTALGNSVNLNGRRQISDTQGWIGTPPSSAGYAGTSGLPKPATARWVEVSQKDGLVSGTTPPVTSRYAFWIEDESFRANISFADLGNGHQRSDNASNVLLRPVDVDLLGLLKLLPVNDASAAAQSIHDTRANYPAALFPEARAFAHTDGLGSAASNGLRYLTTSQSSALNLSRHGTQRLNLNRVVAQPSPLPTPSVPDPVATKKSIDQIVEAIQYHAPNFAQRFYRLRLDSPNTISQQNSLNQMDVSAGDYQTAYRYKIAANIYDYIDKDPVPTIINSNKYVHTDGTIDPGGTIRFGAKPLHALYGPNGSDGANEIWAQGKDSAPFIEESAVRLRGGHLVSAPGSYRVAIDYYIEVWNSSNQDVLATDLGPNPVLRVANPPQWISTSPVDPHLYSTDPAPASASPYDSRVKPPLRDYDLDLVHAQDINGLSGPVVFKAGVATVLTTDPDLKQVITDPTAQKNTYVCGFYPPPGSPNATGKRIYNGTLPLLTDKKTPAAGMKMVFGDSSGGTGFTNGSDYETELILCTDNGVVDSIVGGIPMYYNSGATIYLTAATPDDPNAPMAEIAHPFILGGSLHGNSISGYPDVTGDPRSNNEQLSYQLYQSGSAANQTRYFNAAGNFSLGYPDYQFVTPSGGAYAWGDYYAFPSDNKMTATNAPYVIANSALTSIGQLGDVYDPLRICAGDYLHARGGGRTFKIGQHDDRYDGDADSPSRGWASWRLADFFCVKDMMDQPGLININGVPRDNGAALRAALTGFTFQPTTTASSSQPAGKAMSVDSTATNGLQQLIDQIKTRLAATPTVYPGAPADTTGGGPFFERGELSEVPGFSRSAASGFLVSGANPAVEFDREREELFRRLVEMITTRGNVFTVYAMGQAINQNTTSGVKRVNATQQVRVTFKLMPKDSQGNDFHPAYDNSGTPIDLDPLNPQKRFAKPDHYDVQILSASTGNG